jgi:hypothetical protein
MVDLAVAAEESGWDGFFLWDHVLRWPGHEGQAGDTWTALAAIAARTSRIRIGPHITRCPAYGPTGSRGNPLASTTCPMGVSSSVSAWVSTPTGR